MLAKINNFILTLSLRARGYDNHLNSKDSGESFFIKKNSILGCIDKTHSFLTFHKQTLN